MLAWTTERYYAFDRLKIANVCSNSTNGSFFLVSFVLCYPMQTEA
jgi:hypothetical protein